MVELHKKFVELGRARNKLTYELLDLLPEIFESKIYKKYAATIEEYAGKYAGLSNAVVKKRLNLERHLEGKPYLRESIKDVGVHKVALVATLTGPENERAMVDKLKNMSKPAIQMMAKEMRAKLEEGGADRRDELAEVANVSGRPCKAVPTKISVDLDEESTFLFLKLKEKIGGNLSNAVALKNMLRELNEIKTPRPQKCKSLPGEKFRSENYAKNAESRYVSVAKKRGILEKTDGRCAYPGCNKPGSIFHHVDRWAEVRNHKNVVALCREHHEFAHNGLIRQEFEGAENWRFGLDDVHLQRIDYLYQKHRQESLL